MKSLFMHNVCINFLPDDGLIISLALLQIVDTSTVSFKNKDELFEINIQVFGSFILAMKSR